MGNRKARQIEAMGGAVTSAFADECCMEKVFGLESFREMAMEYDKLTTKVAPKKKAVKKVPKVQKSGRGNSKEDVAAEAIKKKRARLQKSGKQHDAASVFYDML